MKMICYMIRLVLSFLRKAKHDRVDAYSAQSAFYVILSFIPFVMLLLTMLQYTPLSRVEVSNMVMGVMPDSFAEFIGKLLSDIYTRSIALLSGTAIAAVWAAGRGVLAVTNGLNSIYDVRETRNYIVMRMRSAFYTVLFLISIIVAMLLLVFGNQLHDAILKNIPLLQQFSGFLISIRTIATISLLVLLFMAIYKLLPNRKDSFRNQLPGAFFTAIAWSVFSYGFSIYFEYVKGMSTIYGSLTVVIMIMLWLYFCMWFIFMGAELNCYLEERSSFDLTDRYDVVK